MNSFIDKEGILRSSQYGLRQKHSTEHPILDIVKNIQSGMDKGHFSCRVFIYLQKAFDTVNHDILLQKLDYYGFRGIINEWFSSYLRQKTQVTIVESQTSDSSRIVCGVPQGSAQGPLRFLLYINDICSCSSRLGSFFLLMTRIYSIHIKTLKLRKNRKWWVGKCLQLAYLK